MATKKAFTTPKGVSMYVYLNKPDYKYNQDGRFQVQLRLPKNEAKPLMDVCRETANDEYGKKASTATMPWKEEETGEIVFKAHSKYKPRFVDSSGAVIREGNEPTVASGSVLRLAGNIYPYTAAGRHGLSLQLGGVQIVELATGANFDFEAEEDGYLHAENDNNAAADEEVGHNF